MTQAMVNWLIFLPLAGALLCLLVPRPMVRSLTMLTTLATLAINLFVAQAYYASDRKGAEFVTSVKWIDALNVYYRVGVDGLSLPLCLLTTGLSVLVVLASWRIDRAVRAYMSLYLMLLSTMLGVFLAMDLFLFYVFFELSLVPMYFLIGIWGGPKRAHAAIKFFLYTLAGSVCLLIVMLGIYFTTSKLPTGNTWLLTDAKTDTKEVSLIDPQVRELFTQRTVLEQKKIDAARATAETNKRAYQEPKKGMFASLAPWFFWLSFLAFAVKIPVAPLHTWLPDAHVEAPTPISMVLAGVLLKLGGYAMMRVTWPMFPEAAHRFWFFIAILGVFGILYGAFCAMAQTDWKRLVAYSSVSHMGFVTLGLAVMTRTAFDGAYFQMIAHGVTSAMMFFIVGVVYERAHHRDIDRLGGLWLKFPALGFWSIVGFFAAMGLPGLCGFIGEIMVLLGTFAAGGKEQVSAALPMRAIALGGLAAISVILTAGYMLWMFQRVYMGPEHPEYVHYRPITVREYVIMGLLGFAAVVLGVLPVIVFNVTGPTVDRLFEIFRSTAKAMAATGS